MTAQTPLEPTLIAVLGERRWHVPVAAARRRGWEDVSHEQAYASVARGA